MQFKVVSLGEVLQVSVFGCLKDKYTYDELNLQKLGHLEHMCHNMTLSYIVKGVLRQPASLSV